MAPKTWQPLVGTFEIGEDQISYKGAVLPATDAEPERGTVGLAVCDLPFTGGRVSMKFRLLDDSKFSGVQIVLYRDPEGKSLLVAGIGTALDSGTFVVKRFGPGAEPTSGSNWTSLDSSGDMPLDLDRDYQLAVEKRGATIDVYLDDVHVLRSQKSIPFSFSQCGVFCWARTGTIKISEFRVDAKPRTAFVVMQFSEQFDALYADVIKPVTESAGYEVIRADEMHGPGVIIADIVRRILDADLVIAEITPTNPNVFYEVGFAHAIGKPTILIKESGEKLPFDLSPFRTLFYENSIAGKSRIEQGLRQHLDAIKRAIGPRGS